jgi:tRNA pseudouridine32 synthase/23S rRNA pseudouridine746 synthase
MVESIHDLFVLPPCDGQVSILQYDPDFLLVDKPHRLLTVPGRNPLNSDCVISRLQGEYPGAAIVHRLDFDTSGILVVPLTKAALSHISRQFQQRTTRKIYQALVYGLVADDRGRIDLPIAPDPDHRPKYKVCHQTGKASVTEYRVLHRDPEHNTTRLALNPITGRSHQLRLHLQAIGHPILGCEFYAEGEARAAADRLLLHAEELGFVHPRTGEPVVGYSPVPF